MWCELLSFSMTPQWQVAMKNDGGAQRLPSRNGCNFAASAVVGLAMSGPGAPSTTVISSVAVARSAGTDKVELPRGQRSGAKPFDNSHVAAALRCLARLRRSANARMRPRQLGAGAVRRYRDELEWRSCHGFAGS